jgi:hypothetical protein
LESGGWVVPRREWKEKGLRWWEVAVAVEWWLEVVEAVVPLEERLEERKERARFLRGGGGWLVS